MRVRTAPENQMANTFDLAQGKWETILTALGVSPAWLSRKPVDCPICEKKKKYRWTNLEGNGTFVCTCGSGNGFTIIRFVFNCDFKTAARKVDDILGDRKMSDADKRAMNDAKKKKLAEVEYLKRLWSENTSPDIVAAYLKSRGLNGNYRANGLRGHLGLDLDGARHPAMLAQIVKGEKCVALHRTWFLPDGKREKKTIGSGINGGAIRLFPAGDILGVAEGVETALACYELFGIPVWSCVSAGGMESVELPDTVKRVVIFIDNDLSYTGHKAGYALAHRLVVREKRQVTVKVPPMLGDFLDVLNRGEVCSL
jgi:putative DNA primase/helicase